MVENDTCSGGSSKQNALFEKICPKKLTYALLSRIGSGSISFASNSRKFLLMNLIYIMNLQQLFANPWLFHCFPLVIPSVVIPLFSFGYSIRGYSIVFLWLFHPWLSHCFPLVIPSVVIPLFSFGYSIRGYPIVFLW